MEWVKPIEEVEAEFRRKGVFVLADIHSKKLWFYGYKCDTVAIKQMMAMLKGRSDEMGKFLIMRARVQRGEIT